VTATSVFIFKKQKFIGEICLSSNRNVKKQTEIRVVNPKESSLMIPAESTVLSKTDQLSLLTELQEKKAHQQA
jgi:hypothetical protein